MDAGTQVQNDPFRLNIDIQEKLKIFRSSP